MGDIKQAAQRADGNDALELAIKVGLVAYGVVHLLVGWLAVQVAFGEQSKTASSSGAMHTLAAQPLGAVLVWIVALGLLALVVWRGLEAWEAWRTEDGGDRLKSVVGNAGKGVIYAVLAFSALQTALADTAGGGGGGKGGGKSSGGGSTDSLTAKLMDMPGGTLIVGAVGLGVIAYAGYYVYQGWTEKFLEKLDGGPRSREASKAYRLLGKVGFIAKGVAIGVIGALFVYAAVTHDPKKSAGMDQALSEIAQQPFGQALLVAVGVGIACYGVFCFARARHLSR